MSETTGLTTGAYTLPPVQSVVSVGRVVHYAAGGEEDASGVHRAAIVTQVHSDECVDLAVFLPTGMLFRPVVLHVAVGARAGYDAGTWHFPERVGP